MSSSTAEEKREAIVDGLRSRLQQMPDERFDDLSDPRAVGENMAVFVPESPGAFSKIIGPVYSTRAAGCVPRALSAATLPVAAAT